MARVRQALAGHGLDGEAVQDALASLSATEFDRAWALWQKKFGTAPADVQTRARQTRFLMARGFGAGIVRQVLRRAADEAGADLPAEPDDGP
jgi:regulatory protein